MVDRALRPLTSRALAPLTRTFADVSPDAITGASLVVGIGAAAAAAVGAFWVALVLWLLNRVLDGLDGEVARHERHGGTRQSDRGGYLDLMADLTVYGALTLGIAAGVTATFTGEPLAPVATTWALAALLVAAYYVNLGSYTLFAALLEKRGLGARQRGHRTSVIMPAGLVEGAETVVLISLLLAVPSLAPALFGIGASLVALTAGQRVLWASRMLRAAP
ncbi:MAG: CDP-alcohol phosphatidyltransferase family protein [Trueperaceae bacterium]|nr:CDP-alcohol phosphatidyltransferase family protein [Trueperaceae bacterium]